MVSRCARSSATWSPRGRAIHDTPLFPLPHWAPQFKCSHCGFLTEGSGFFLFLLIILIISQAKTPKYLFKSAHQGHEDCIFNNMRGFWRLSVASTTAGSLHRPPPPPLKADKKFKHRRQSRFVRPNSPATEHRGGKEGQGAALIHVSPGQIIYHLVQTNSVLDSLSEEEGGAREVREGCQRRCSLTPITLPLISPPWPSPHYSTHAASVALVSVRRAAHERWPSCKEVSRLHLSLPPTLPFIYSRNLCATHQARGPRKKLGGGRRFTSAGPFRAADPRPDLRSGRGWWVSWVGGGVRGCIWPLGSRLIGLSHPQHRPGSARSSNQ